MLGVCQPAKLDDSRPAPGIWNFYCKEYQSGLAPGGQQALARLDALNIISALMADATTAIESRIKPLSGRVRKLEKPVKSGASPLLKRRAS